MLPRSVRIGCEDGGTAARGRHAPTARDGQEEAGDVAARCADRSAVPSRVGPDRARRGAAHRRAGGERTGLHPRRCRHGQDPHHHPPHRLRRAHGRLRAGAGSRRDLHRSGGGRAARATGRPRRRRGAGPHLPRGGHAAAALLRPPRPRRPDALAGREQAAAGGHGGVPVPAVDRPHQSARPRQRDRVGEDDAGHARRLPGPGQGGGTGATVRGGRRGGGLRQLRVGQAARRRARLRGPAARHGVRAGGAPGGRPGGARAVPPLRRRRVPGRQPAPAAVAGRLARGPRRGLRGRRPQPDDLLVHRCRSRLPAGLRRPLSRCHGRQARARLPLDAAGGGARQPPDRAGAATQGAARAAAARSAARRSRADLRRASGRARRGGRRRGAVQGADRRGHAGGGDRGAVPHQRPVRGVRGGAHRRRGALRAQGRRTVLRAARDPRGRAAAARCRRRRQRTRRAGPHDPRRPGVDRLGGAPSAARRRGPGPLAVAGRAGRSRGRPGRRELRRWTWPAS